MGPAVDQQAAMVLGTLVTIRGAREAVNVVSVVRLTIDFRNQGTPLSDFDEEICDFEPPAVRFFSQYKPPPVTRRTACHQAAGWAAAGWAAARAGA